MPRDGERRTLTEPVPLPCVLITGIDIQTTDEHVVRLVMWCDIPVVGYDQPESRVQARVAMADGTFRKLLADGRRLLARGSH